MNELQKDLDLALGRVAPSWDEARTERTLAGLPRKRMNRGIQTATLSAVMVAATCWSLYVWVGGRTESPDAVLTARGPLPVEEGRRTMEFADGSRVQLIDETTKLRVDRVSSSELMLHMSSGRARFEVVPNETRTFSVDCGHLVVEVLGTEFEILHESSRTRVEVFRGRVAVRWAEGSTELGMGESRWFGEEEPEPPSTDAAAAEQEEEAVGASSSARAEQGRSWREQAENGEFARAYEIIKTAPSAVGDNVQDLLLAADAARLSGHPADAVPYLRRVMDRHAGDRRASLAAFTLGNVLMNQLGRPREAEAAYARARSLSPDGALAQDAVARQVEAAHRAGDTARARTLALEYLELYPKGRRVNAVRRFGGLE